MNLQTTVKFSANNFKAMLRRNVVAYKLSNNTFSVPSTSRQGIAHLVSISFNREGKLDVKCGCEAGKAKMGCAHALRVVHDIQNNLSLMRAITPKAAMPSQRRAA